MCGVVAGYLKGLLSALRSFDLCLSIEVGDMAEVGL